MMNTRFPIYAKILGWFFLNLLVVFLVAGTLLWAHLGNTTEWLLAADAKDRIRSMVQVLAAELEHTPTAFHNEVLGRYSDAYHIVFSVYSNDGKRALGPELEMPANVLQVLSEGDKSHPPEEGPPGGGPPDDRPPPPPPRPRDDNPFGSFFGPLDDPSPRELEPDDREGGRRERRRPPPSVMMENVPLDLVRSEKSSAMWLLVRAPMIAAVRGIREHLTLVGRIDSVADNSLFFDVRPLLWWGLALLLFSALFWLPLVSSLTRAITQLTRATERIAEGDFDTPVNESRQDELGRLGHAINQMSSRLSGFVRGQKRFLGDIAHELCSPLVRMEMGLGVVEQRCEPDLKERLQDVQDDVREMRELVNELLSFSKAGLRTPDAPLTSVNVHNLVEEAIEREGEGKAAGETDPEIQVLGDPRLLLRALMNLVRNAVRYAGSAGGIQVSTQENDEGQVSITVSDNGPGVPPEALPRLFDAFYRPDEARSRETGGVGLGLAIVKSCVEACGGTVTARNRDEGGFAVEMRLQGA